MNIRFLTFKRLAILAEQGDVSDIVNFHTELSFGGSIRIGFKRLQVPLTMDEFRSRITWGQRLFFSREPIDYIDGVFRLFCGWFYPILTGKEFDETKCLTISGKALNCNVDELLPFVTHMSTMIGAMLSEEERLTGGSVDKTWIAAGGEKLNKYGDKVTLDFLVPKLSIMYGKQVGHSDVMASPYADCLVQLMERKEFNEVENEYRELTNLKAQGK